MSWAKISSITNVTVSDAESVALNLELNAPIDTTTTMLVSTMHSGSPARLRESRVTVMECCGNLTNGKYPYRVAGIEMQVLGAYVEQLDPLWKAEPRR